MKIAISATGPGPGGRCRPAVRAVQVPQHCRHGDRCALSPVYSFLSEEDQISIIQKVHSEQKSSVVMTDEIKDALAHNRAVDWYSVRCSNFGMLHSYSTVIGTEKSRWIPFSGYEEDI